MDPQGAGPKREFIDPDLPERESRDAVLLDDGVDRDQEVTADPRGPRHLPPSFCIKHFVFYFIYVLFKIGQVVILTTWGNVFGVFLKHPLGVGFSQ